jgi:hypothetical protein
VPTNRVPRPNPHYAAKNQESNADNNFRYHLAKLRYAMPTVANAHSTPQAQEKAKMPTMIQKASIAEYLLGDGFIWNPLQVYSLVHTSDVPFPIVSLFAL